MSQPFSDSGISIKMRTDITEKPNERKCIPFIPAIRNFESARQMAQENLEHQPLPDSILDQSYRKLQARGDINPELALNVFPVCTGERWR